MKQGILGVAAMTGNVWFNNTYNWTGGSTRVFP